MKCLFLYNPNSGKGKIKKKTALVEKMLKRKYDEVVLCATQSGTDMEEKARLGAETFDAIVFAGGDGTFNNVLQGIGERDVRLGYLPTGTANDVAHSLGIPRGIKKALKIVLNGNAQKVDCMRVNKTHYAMYIVAAGAFTCVTYSTPQTAKKRLGWAAYAAEGLKHGMDFGSFPVAVDCGGEHIETDCVLMLAMNGRSVAGFPVNKKASMQDGIMEVAIVKKPAKRRGRLSSMLTIAHLFLSGGRVGKKKVEFLRGAKVTVRTGERVVWDFDGEKGISGDIEIELCRGRVNMFVPQKKKI